MNGSINEIHDMTMNNTCAGETELDARVRFISDYNGIRDDGGHIKAESMRYQIVYFNVMQFSYWELCFLIIFITRKV